MLQEFRQIVLSKVERIVSFIRPQSGFADLLAAAIRLIGAGMRIPWCRFRISSTRAGRKSAIRWRCFMIMIRRIIVTIKSRRTLEWIRAILRFWARLQKTDGSFSEVLEDGHEQPSTATSTAAMCHAWLRILPFITSEEKQVCMPAFKRAAEFLVRHPNHVSLRYEAASLTALYGIHNIMPRFNFDVFASEKLEQIAKLQSPDGWVPRIGGSLILATTRSCCSTWRIIIKFRMMKACGRSLINC